MTDVLRRNANLVEALGSALREGDHALGTVPALLKRVLGEGSWREFTTQRGEHVVHEQFVDFVTALPLKGLGTDVALVRRVVADDPEALDLLDQALHRPHGGDRSKRNNVTLATDPNQRGTSKDYALRKLRKAAPELHAEVLAGRLSAHRAMVNAGYRHPTFTMRSDSPEAIAAAIRRHLPPDVIAKVIAALLAVD